ncbi:MAG: TldD/PmbA family protein [Acidobacteria bacterium]|nr:TldD/PmbA family protein [Acidobacteriota bacterium]
MLLTREESKALAEKILGLAKADEVEVSIRSSQNCNSRYANNSITTAGFTSDLSVSIEVTKETKRGQVSVNELNDEALAAAVCQAEAIAELSPANPEYVEPLGPQAYPEIKGFHEETARARSAELQPAVKTVIAAAEQKKVNAYGYYDATARAQAIANRRGLFGYHRSTWASYSVTARTPDGTGSGWAEQESPRLSAIQAAAVGDTAIRKAVESREPRRLEPGNYTVILEPAALAEMLLFMSFSMGARAADEGRSFLSKRGGGNLLGEKVFGENVTLASDPFDPRVPGLPWSSGGFFFGGGGDWLPTEKMVWVENGVVKNLVYNRFWAKKSERKPVPFPSNWLMAGGTAKLDDLIASTERGLLVTRFWYIRFLQPQTLQLTGLTRDGLFYIEKGKVVHPAMNFRFNESVVKLLNSIEAMTPAVPVGNYVLPAVKVREFHFSSLSDAV